MYYFFQDESFHDLKITEKGGELNFDHLDASPYFVNVFLGFSDEIYKDIKESYREWENDNKKYLGIKSEDEFKSESIKAKNFEFGLASMNLRYINFYSYLFDLLNQYDIIIQLSTTNKLELLISNVFAEYFAVIENLIYQYDLPLIKYSLIKLIDRHRTSRLIKLLFDTNADSKLVISEIGSILDRIITEQVHYPHLSREVDTAKLFKELLNKLSFTISALDSYNWDYSWSFDGLMGLLNEINIPDKDIVLFLDGKSWRTEGMFKAAVERFHFAEILREESENHVGIRVADFLSNFIGRIIRNLDLDIRTANISNITYIDEEWFNVRKEGFECYKLLGSVLRTRQNIYWTTQVGIYFDIAILFYKFIDYFCNFKDYETYRDISNREHTEILNVIVKHALSSRLN
ncbi:hypothetical protein D8798_01635 [Streptococcus cristatus]|uniref:DUF3800 domain-containing protein n=1 Tax=Streptococcus cristatus TaxID=45634 RepID=A0A3R9MIV8_STRCR|nr:DUF3800 domain-containing protein [Streptococcus cristatus]RSJ77863.1 hypothetical protein D8798_01635 [Streptococcus cristatus]